MRPLQERAPVVDVHAHAGILVRMLRMQVAAEPLQHGIDLDRVDVRRPFRQGQRDVVPAPRPHDEDVAGTRRQMGVRIGVERLLGQQHGERGHGLVRPVVHPDRDRAVVVRRVRHVLVGRPDVPRLQERDDAQDQQDRQARPTNHVSSVRKRKTSTATATRIHTNGPASANESAENATIPAMLPSTSSR